MHGDVHLIPLIDGTADPLRGVVERGEHRHRLTEIERRLLRYVCDHPGEALTRQQLLVEVWDYAPTVRSRAADHTIARLRTKIEPDAAEPQLLQTVHGVGYRWVPPQATEPTAPLPPVDLVGRADALAALKLALSTHRRVAVVGPMGVGKSALAAAAAPEWLGVDLSAAKDAREALGLLARALGVPMVVEAEQLAAAVAARSPLLLDGADVPGFDRAWAAWPDALLLITSRRHPGGVDHILPLGPLEADDAVQLLRAAAVASGAAHEAWGSEPALRRLAERVDGLPLALQLAGAQASWLAPEQVLAQLDAAPTVVLEGSRGLVQSVGAALDALTAPQRTLLERLSVFHAASLGAVAGLGGMSHLRALVERSLVWAQPGRVEVQYRVLRPVADVVRALSPDGLASAREAHAGWVCAEAFARADHPCHDVNDPVWWHRHLHELQTAAQNSPHPDHRARLALCMVRLGGYGWIPEPHVWLRRAEAAADEARDPSLLCATLALRARYDDTDPSGDLARAAELAITPRDHAMVLQLRALVTIDQGDYERARQLAEEAFAAFEACGCHQGALDTLFPLVDTLHPMGRGEEALAVCTRAIRLAQRADDVRGLGIAYAIRGYATENFADTLADQQRALDTLEAVHDLNAAIRIRLIRARMQAMGGYDTEPVEAIVAWADELGQPRLSERARIEAAAIALHQGDTDAMHRWVEGLTGALSRDGFTLLHHMTLLARGEVTLATKALREETDDPATANATGGFFFAVAALMGDDPSRWLPAIERMEALNAATGRFNPFTRFVALYAQLAHAFRAAVLAIGGDREGAEAQLDRAEALDTGLPAWRTQAPGWRALVAGEPLPQLPIGPEGWAMQAMAARR